MGVLQGKELSSGDAPDCMCVCGETEKVYEECPPSTLAGALLGSPRGHTISGNRALMVAQEHVCWIEGQS